MPVQLNAPFSWIGATGDTATMLDELQPNIIRPHTREFMTVLFLAFAQPTGGKAFLKALLNPVGGAGLLKSAKAHMLEVKTFAETGKSGTPYVGVGLTGTGYAAIGVPSNKRPPDPSFRGGMKAASLGDPVPAQWDAHYRSDIHAVVIVADALPEPRDEALAAVRALIASSPGVTVLGQEIGHGLHNKNGDGIEHFGYVDGRSQPLFLLEDIAEERLRTDGATTWDPAFAPNRVVTADRAAPDPVKHFGSYFVFRKLEQNVRTFKDQERKLAKRLGLTGDDEERAGAMLVGRFEDGTPLTLQFGDGSHRPVPNNFDFDSDPDGAKCPFFGHIRKVNPRGSGGFEPVAQERLHIMARRGQTYGVRTDDPNDGKIKNKPSKDVGLLFMAFNVDIAVQFEFAQGTWANNAGFPAIPPGRQSPGLDPVIGQGARSSVECPVQWGGDPSKSGTHKVTTQVPQAVIMKGGEYFFMPSLAFLRSL